MNVPEVVPNEPVVKTPPVVVIIGRPDVPPIAPALVILPWVWDVAAKAPVKASVPVVDGNVIVIELEVALFVCKVVVADVPDTPFNLKDFPVEPSEAAIKTPSKP